MQRRAALRYVGTVGLAALAGCLGNGEQAATDTRTDTDTAKPAVTGRSFAVTGTGPGKQTQSASVSFDGGVTVTGTTTGSSGCYTAKLKAVAYDHPELVVTVRATEKKDAGVCTEVITNIDYEASFEFAGKGPERVVVEHESMGETHTATKASRSG